MENVGAKIYKKYKQIGPLYLAYGEKAKLIKMIIIMELAISSYLLSLNSNGYLLLAIVLLFALFVTLMVFTEKRVFKKYPNKLNGCGNFRRLECIQLNLLREFIEEEKLFTPDGLKYLIDIYKTKSSKKSFKNIAFGAILVSAIINNLITFVLKGGEKDWNNIYLSYGFIKQNTNFIMSISIVIIIYYFTARFFYKTAILEYKNFMWKVNYERLIEILEYIYAYSFRKFASLAP